MLVNQNGATLHFTSSRKTQKWILLHFIPGLKTHHVRVPEGFTHAVQLFGARPSHNKVLGFHGAANQIHRGNVGLISLGIQTRNNWLNKVGPKPIGDVQQAWVENVSVYKTSLLKGTIHQK